jgi:hypothetical protein
MDTSFPAHYSAELSPELPGTGDWKVREYFFPMGYKPKAVGYHLVIRVHGADLGWIGHFPAESAQAAIWSMPDSGAMLVVAGDDAYYLPVREPEKCIALGIYGATVTSVAEQGIVIVTSFTGVLAIDRSGVRWRLADLFVDDTRVVSVDDKRVILTGYDYARPDGEGKHISIDINTGQPESFAA